MVRGLWFEPEIFDVETNEDGDRCRLPLRNPHALAPKGEHILEAEARDTLRSIIPLKKQSNGRNEEAGRCLGSTEGFAWWGYVPGTYGSQLQHPNAAAGCTQPRSSPEAKRTLH